MFTLVEILTYRMVASIKETVSRQGPRLGVYTILVAIPLKILYPGCQWLKLILYPGQVLYLQIFCTRGANGKSQFCMLCAACSDTYLCYSPRQSNPLQIQKYPVRQALSQMRILHRWMILFQHVKKTALWIFKYPILLLFDPLFCKTIPLS